MPSKKLCTHLAQEKQAYYCLLKHAVIPLEYVDRVCKGDEPLIEACIKAYLIDHTKRLYTDQSNEKTTSEVSKNEKEKMKIDELITVENVNAKPPKLETNSEVIDEEETDFLEELLLKVPNAKDHLKKITKPTPPPPSPPPPPPRQKLIPPPPKSEPEIIKTKNYPERAKDYESMALKMRDSGLNSEAAIDICCASLAWILANNTQYAIRSLKNFVDTLDEYSKEQIRNHPAFLLSRTLVAAAYHKDKGEFDEAKGKFYEAEVYTRDLYSKLQYGEDKAFIAESMKKIEEMLKG
jgi:hypothetical protein